MSLRRRLVVGMLLLLGAGIVVADVVTSSSLRSFLYGRIDEQVDVSQQVELNYIFRVYERDLKLHDRLPVTNPEAWLAELNNPIPDNGTGLSTPSTTGAPSLTGDQLTNLTNPDAYVEVLGFDGKVIYSVASGPSGRPDPAPVLPRTYTVQRIVPRHPFGAGHGVYQPERPSIYMSALGRKGVYYRGQAVAIPGGTLITAISVDPTEKTLASLTHIEVLVSIIVIVALLVLVLWIVRLGLRPLDDMTNTAGAIAGGDLTRRVGRADDRSEVGRLGTALNGMLSQVEAAFEERRSSEDRLRRFVADASHELRTPLTSVRGYAELLRKGAFDTDEARRRAAERIEGEAARMSLLVDDLLLLARLDQGRPLELTPVDLGRIVTEAVDAARVQDPGRAVTLDTDGPVVIDGDAARLRQIADNLLQNAILHTRQGTPVHVTVVRQQDSAVLEVADEGLGLEAAHAARVFDRFYQGSEARTGEGTGLGLSIVAALATAHGGRAGLRSVPGQGAVFTVEFPAASPGPTSRARPPSPPGPRRRPGHPRRVRLAGTDVVPPLFVVDRGAGDPVLLVHGQPGLGTDWDAVAGRLGDHRLLVPDRPGYGASGHDTLGIRANAEVLAQLLTERSTAPATVVGHSYGGGVAIMLAAARPELVAGLVLVGSIGRAADLKRADRVLAAPVVGEALSATALFALAHLLPFVRRVAEGGQQHPLLAWLRASLPDARYGTVSSRRGQRIWRSFVTEQRTLLAEIADVEAAVAEVSAPTVVITGAWDLVVPPSVSAAMAAAIPGSELVTVARTGHFVPRDAPGVVASAVRRVEDRFRTGLRRHQEQQDTGS